MKIAVAFLVLCLSFLVYAQLPDESTASKISLESNEIDDSNDSSENKEDDSSTGSPGAISTIISSVIQLPMRLFKAFNTLITNSPFARLREEMNALNISYPKK